MLAPLVQTFGRFDPQPSEIAVLAAAAKDALAALLPNPGTTLEPRFGNTSAFDTIRPRMGVCADVEWLLEGLPT